MDPSSGILAPGATIENRGPGSRSPSSRPLRQRGHLPPGQYTLNYLTGRWAGEWNLNQEPLLSRRARSRKPPRVHRTSGQPLVRHSSRQRRRRPRRSLVRSARLERFLAHHRRAGPTRRSPHHRRLQPLRFRLRPQARRKARHAHLLRRLRARRPRRSIPPPAPI